MVPQLQLFGDESAPWEADDQAEELVATVVFATGPAGEFDYRVPEGLLSQVEPGRRVRVPLGRSNRTVIGYCVALGYKPSGPRRKPVLAVLDPQTLLSPSMLALTRWIAEYYLCPWGVVLESVLPSGVRQQVGTRLATLLSIDPAVRGRIAELKLPPAQRAVLEALAASDQPLTPAQLCRVARCSAAPIAALRRKGLIRSSAERVLAARPLEPPARRQAPWELNAHQKRALAAILDALESRQHRTILIHGVTGSGKTEVYIQAIEHVARFGRQAIVLVPEISLTPQTLERFRARFSGVAVLHSHLSDVERHQQWQRIAAGQVQVVVGARSAVFAPTPHLGLIVLDEEHETSFKQETAPRYHAREVALARAKAEKVPLVLGSATPSLESWHRACTGQYVLVEMPHRIFDRPMPAVGTIDLRDDEHLRQTRGAISRVLHQAIRRALDEGGQVILLLNRRGYSTHIQCPACGHVIRCPHCEVALTHHRSGNIALCHYCDYQIPAPCACPRCQFTGIYYGGRGTQRLEAEVRARFPDAPCLRMDTDSMKYPGSHEKALAAFRQGKVRILVGTQMIAKGLDFPEVTLVGVVNADTALHFPDFRAAERTFQLVTQVAGRTGRGDKPGRVLVQTHNPDHPAILAAVRHDFASFATAELPLRQMLKYPPFAHMVRLVVRGPVEAQVRSFAETLAGQVRTALGASPEARVLGPAPAPFAKLRGFYRYQIQLQGPDGEALRQAVRQAEKLAPPEHVQWIADVDPIDML